MADIGVMPSRTTVRITSTTGENGTIPGATPRAAGCMTADHASRLETLWQVHETASGGQLVVIERPAPAHDSVTLTELRAMLGEVQKAIAAPVIVQAPAGPDAVSPRLDEIERQIADLQHKHGVLAGVVARVLDHLDQVDQVPVQVAA